jgi:multiple sugar transport system permease protein
VLFVIILSAIMIPTEMLIIPWDVIIAKLKLIYTYLGILMPSLVTTFAIFVMRQFIASIPDEILDDALIDSVSEFGLFWNIWLPIARSTLAVVVIFTFLSNWNDFL